MKSLRQIVLDTETTGLEVNLGHRIIEIGGVEIVNRRLTGRHYHQYINPEREIDQGAIEVHGLTLDKVRDKPLFAQIAQGFLEFVDGAELIIHNASFDVGFINAELKRLSSQQADIDQLCSIIDTLKMAKKKHPGQKNDLDSLCRRYGVDNSQRDLHGALLDAEILADVYLTMTGGQTTFTLDSDNRKREAGADSGQTVTRLSGDRPPLAVIRATEAELQAHEQFLTKIAKTSAD